MGTRGTLFNADGTVHRTNTLEATTIKTNNVRKNNRDRLRPKTSSSTSTSNDKRPKGLIHTIGNIFKSVWPFSNDN